MGHIEGAGASFSQKELVGQRRIARWLGGLARWAGIASEDGDGAMSESNRKHNGNGGRHQAQPRPVAVGTPEDSRSAETMEWDALAEGVENRIRAEFAAAERESSDKAQQKDGPYFPAFRIGPQAYRDPRLAGPDWRELAPEGSDARKDAEENPITPYDKDYQKVLRAAVELEHTRTNS